MGKGRVYKKNNFRRSQREITLIKITKDTDGYEDILTSEALEFVEVMAKRYTKVIDKYLYLREISVELDFSVVTEDIRNKEWQVADIPEEIADRRVEITGPVERKMVINALNSGANVFMADFEDSNSPTWENCIQGQTNLRDAVSKTIEHYDDVKDKHYKLNSETAVLFVRPRGFHLKEKHVLVDGVEVPASIFDFALYFFHNAKTLLESGSRPYFYLPKIEHSREAQLWKGIFRSAEEYIGIPKGTIRATVLLETFPATFQMEEILYELKEYSAGLNCGRWDYIFSYIKTMKDDKERLVPDRDLVGMEQHFMKSYSELLVATCHKRGAHAMGGMAAQIPIKNDEKANKIALKKVKKDKIREVKAGHDGTWVAHPGLVPIAKKAFDRHMKKSNQINKKRRKRKEAITAEDLTRVPDGEFTRTGFSKNIDVSLRYLNAWLSGNGCVPINNLMEDAATAEISRVQLWQWIKHGATLEDGTVVTQKYFQEELQKTSKQLDISDTVTELLQDFCLQEELDEFLTTKAYQLL